MARPARRYSYKTKLVSQGVDFGGRSQDDILDLIADASDYVEILTDQVFAPMVDVAEWDGRGSSIIFDPQRLRILEATSVSINFNRVTSGGTDDKSLQALVGDSAIAVPVNDYVLYKRSIEKLRGFKWPLGSKCMIVTGVFGWLDPFKTKVETAVNDVAGLVSNATTVTVDSSAGFELGDIVLLGTNLLVILSSIPDGTTLGFDTVGTLSSALADNALVRTWGRVPGPIAALTAHLVQQFIDEEQARADAQQIIDAARIKKETTDRYSYELFSPEQQGLGSITGSIRHDVTLRKYGRPAIAQMI